MEKTCAKCKRSKPISDFYHNKGNKDGLEFWCMDCKKAYIKNRRKTDIKYKKAQQEINNKWRKEHPEKYRVHAKEYRAKYPLRTKSVYKAQKIKIIGLCYFCSSNSNLLRHHPDYNLPEQIIILCKSCHRKLHLILKITKSLFEV